MSIQIFILSKLMEDNSYPYKFKKQLSEPLPLDKLAGLTESKLYYNFDSLAKKGLVEIIEIIKEEHRPDKQVFAITDKGREELPKLIYKLFKNADAVSDMVVGLSNLKYVDRHKVVEILEKKLKDLMDRWNYIKSYESYIPNTEGKEKFVEFMSEYFSTKSEHTIHWLEELIKRIKHGEI